MYKPIQYRLILVSYLLLFSCKQLQLSSEYNSHKLQANEAGKEHPFGKPNDKANFPVNDYKKLIGISKCKSLQYRQGKPGDTLDLIWRWKYILNGMAIQDDAWYGNDSFQSSYSSIRMYDKLNTRWNVSFYIPQITGAQTWTGKSQGDSLIFKRLYDKNQNGSISNSTFIFSEITDSGYKWTGKNHNSKTKKNIIFWEIWCEKVQ